MNAIKFTPSGGSVWIGATAEPGLRADTLDIVFSVEDTGVGLEAGQVTRVWERFYQAESSSSRRFGGAGLGLSIVRRLAELHGGRVEAISAGLDRGSTFAVHLPAIVPGSALDVPAGPAGAPHWPAATEGELEPRATDPSAPLILVVEDDVHIATVLRTYLESDGYRVALVHHRHQ